MDIQKFWDIIEQAHIEQGAAINDGIAVIQKELIKLEVVEIFTFQHYFDTYKQLADRSMMLGVGALLMGCSSLDETVNLFSFFLDGVLLYGKDRYKKTLLDPDSFVETLAQANEDEYDIEALNCLTYDVILEKDPQLDYRKMYEETGLEEEEIQQMQAELWYHDQMDITWDVIEDLQEILPRIYKEVM